MIFNILYSILIGLALLLVSCHRSETSEVAGTSEQRVIQMPEMTKEIKLPTKVWDLAIGASFEKSIQQSNNFIFAPIVVKLEDKTPGVLTEPMVRLQFPKAGGEVDFAKYVKNDKGSFKISFEFEGFSDANSLKVYYVSKARKRKIDDDIYGSGCKEFFDVKDYLVKVNDKGGLVVNVTRNRHDSAVGGHFLFSFKKEKQTYISQVTFTDSKRSDLFCE